MISGDRRQLQRALDAARDALTTSRQAVRRFDGRPECARLLDGSKRSAEQLERHVAELEAELSQDGTA